MDDSLYDNMKKKNKLDELNEEEKEILNSFGCEFINMLENTAMSKSYKLPVFLAFYNNGNMKNKIDDEDLYKSFKEFYTKGSNKVDMLNDKSTKDFMNWDKKNYISLARKNPVKFLLKSSSEFFYEHNNYVSLNDELEKFLNNNVFIQNVKDTIDFRTKEYYKNRYEKK